MGRLIFLTPGMDGGNLILGKISVKERESNMNRTSLNESLRQLRAELASIEPADEPARDSLAKLDAEIHRILQEPGQVTPDYGYGLRESLENSLVYYEASHPTLTGLMNRVLKALSDMGI
jgi:hypothetical protein